ncbi:MAG: AI-2E family transporter [Lachnospiraceae bacterium]|nr:AI-2E family transporter [Lachnospiraceae bacterium]
MKRFMAENRRYLELLVASIIIIGLFALLFVKSDWLLKELGKLIGVLKPFIYGFVVAYLLMPVTAAIEKLLKEFWRRCLHKEASSFRAVSIVITFVLVLAVIVLLIYAVIPGLANSIKTLVREIPGAYRKFERWLTDLANESDSSIVDSIAEAIKSAISGLYGKIQNSLLPNLENILSTLTSGFGGLIGALKNLLLSCVVAIYMLAGWEKFGAQAKIMLYGLVSENAADWICKELSLTDKLFGGFISGKIIDSAIIGLICFVFCAMVNMPYALLVSVIVGVTNIIPFFGPYIGAIPSALLILIESPTKCVIFIVFIIILQQIDGNVIGPKILGDRVGISSFWILFAILFFGSYWGIIGMLVGVPVFGVIYDFVKRIIRFGLQKRGKVQMLADYEMEYPEPKKEKKEKKKKRAKESRDE